MIHIVFFSPYPELSNVIEQVFRERPDKDGLTYEIILDSFNNTLQQGCHGDVIISRGFTAGMLKGTSLPNAELKTSGYDVIAAVDRCLKEHPDTKKIAVVGAFNMVYGSESVSQVYKDVTIKSYFTEKEIYLKEIVKQAIEDGAQMIVGGCSTVTIAQEHRIPCQLIESGKEAINNAIDEAIRTVVITRKERQKSNLAIQTGVFLLLAAFYTQLGGMPEEAKGYPTFLLAACAVVNASILFSNLRNLRGEEAVKKDPAAPAMIRRVIQYIVVLGLYIFMIEKIRYVLSTLLFCVASLQIMRVRSWKMQVLLPLCLTISAYVVFSRFLMISLPVGTWIHFGF